MTLAVPAPDVTAETQTGPVNSVTDSETGSRVYIHPITGERFTSVTTILSLVAKDALQYWAAKVVQEKAMDMIPALVQSLRRRPCDMKGDDRCWACRDCIALELRREPDRQRDEAADRGTRIHTVADHYALHGELRDHDDDIRGSVEQWMRWRDTHQVVFDASEVTVINREHMFAGTLDGVVRCGWMPPKWRHLIGVPLIDDLKSGKGVYDQHALQLAAYRCPGNVVLLPDGSEEPLPDCDPETGLLVHVRPDDFWARPVQVGARTFNTFLHVLGLYRDLHDFGPELIGRAMYKPRDTAAPDSAAA
jgi:hypothetical protein